MLGALSNIILATGHACSPYGKILKKNIKTEAPGGHAKSTCRAMPRVGKWGMSGFMPRARKKYISWFIDSLIHWFIDSLIHWFIDSLSHWVIDSLIHWFIDSWNHSLIHWIIDSTCSIMHKSTSSLREHMSVQSGTGRNVQLWCLPSWSPQLLSRPSLIPWRPHGSEPEPGDPGFVFVSKSVDDACKDIYIYIYIYMYIICKYIHHL